MACNIRILPSAEEEVDAIVSYLFGFGVQVARRFTEEYRHQLELLASGIVDYELSSLPELANMGYRSCRVNSYILLYYRKDNDVIIAHVFHQSQDYARLV